MAKVHIEKYDGGEQYTFMCPGCNDTHTINNRWGFNNDIDSPTFTPSILSEEGQKSYINEQWVEMPRCHSFITDGMIKFLSDCGHEFKNKTEPLPEYEL